MSARTEAIHTPPPRAELLIDPHALAARLAEATPDGPQVRVLDVRWTLTQPNGHAEYLRGHIPGAVYVDLESELSGHGPATLGRHPLPCAEALTTSARRWGLSDGDTVVAYDGGGNFAAARLWWLLRDAGVTDVLLLDGALPAWQAAGFALDTSDVTPEVGNISLHPGHSPSIEFEEVGGFAREHVLIDARATERYTGDAEPIDPRAGHVPGARSLPTSGHLDAAGRFLPTATLRERFASVGAPLPSANHTSAAHTTHTADTPDVGFYCGSGITASHAIFAYALAGGEGALYPGSWSQWSQHPDLPAASGLTP